MKREKVNQYLDYIPLLFLLIEVVLLIGDIITTEYLISRPHYLGFFFLALVSCLFFWKHKVGVLALAFTLLLGILGFISFDIAIAIMTIGKSSNSVNLQFQPIFILWILLHVIISRRHYFGIASKKYWTELKEELTANRP